MKSNTTILIIVLCIAYFTFAKTEPYTPANKSPSQIALDEVQSQKVKVAPQSIADVVWANVTMKKRNKNMWQNIIGADDIIVFRGRPKYKLKNNTIVVGKHISFESAGRGENRAKANANARAKTILDEIKNALRSRNLMVE